MLCDHNPALESRNFIDGLVFSREDPCLWIVYPAGSAGDLLISVLDKHYLRTGCEYYGINDRGRIMLYTSDYEMIDIQLTKSGRITFDEQWFYDFSAQLSKRNLTYSMLDQVIFGCHMYRPGQILQILENFSQAKIINIYPKDTLAEHILKSMANFKLYQKPVLSSTLLDVPCQLIPNNLIKHERVCNVPFGFLFSKTTYDRYYQHLRKFLNLPGALISHDFIEFYLNKQPKAIANALRTYSQSL